MPRIIKKGLRWAARESNVENVPGKPGVYALYNWMGMRCYVGQSKNLQRRIRQHFNDPNMPFTEFTWYQTVPRARQKLEGKLIDKDFVNLWNVIKGRRKR